MQFYIGKQREGPEPPTSPLYQEHMLPFANWITMGEWLPKAFFDPDGPEPLRDGVPLVEGIDHIHDIRPFNQVCMNCHNTFASRDRIFHPMYVGFPGTTVSAALGPLSQSLGVLHAGSSVRERLRKSEQPNGTESAPVTVGISCEVATSAAASMPSKASRSALRR